MKLLSLLLKNDETGFAFNIPFLNLFSIFISQFFRYYKVRDYFLLGIILAMPSRLMGHLFPLSGSYGIERVIWGSLVPIVGTTNFAQKIKLVT